MTEIKMIHLDKAFNKSKQELEKAFARYSSIVSYKESKEIMKDSSIERYFIVYNPESELSFTGAVHFYKDGKPYKKAYAEFKTSGLGITLEQFFRDYEGKVVKLGKELEPVRIREVGRGFDTAVFTYTVDDIYTEKSWQDHLAMLAAEESYLLPPEDQY